MSFLFASPQAAASGSSKTDVQDSRTSAKMDLKHLGLMAVVAAAKKRRQGSKNVKPGKGAKTGTKPQVTVRPHQRLRPFSRLGNVLDDVADVAVRAVETAGALGRFLNIEMKLFDTDTTGVSITNTGSAVLLTDIGQGSAYNQRTGNSVKMVKLILRLRLYASNSVSSTVRVMVVRGNERELALPAWTDLLEAVSSPANIGLLSPYEHSFPDRWLPLFDETMSLVNGDQSQVTLIETQITLPEDSAHFLYQNGTGGIANSAEGQLFLMYLSDQGTMANQPIIDYYSRIVFVDN